MTKKTYDFEKRTVQQVTLVDVLGKAGFSIIISIVLYKGLLAFLGLIGLKSMAAVAFIVASIGGIYAGTLTGNYVTKKFINWNVIIDREKIVFISHDGELKEYYYSKIIPEKYKEKLSKMQPDLSYTVKH